MLVAVTTHGCRLNRSESDAMAELVRAAGHKIVADPNEADLVVLNTCTITHRADADARSAVRRWTRRGAKIVLTGCFVDANPERAAAMPGVGAVLGNADKHQVAAAVTQVLGAASGSGDQANNAASPDARISGPTLVSVTRLTRRMPMTPIAAAKGERARALLKVQDGCNYACSFCIVPSVRGGSRSLPVDETLQQLRGLLAEGSPEVVLTGIHLGTWGRDLRPRLTIHDLVRAIVPHLGAARLRLSSIDPHEVDDALIGLLAAHPQQLCAHLHMPVQSADDDTLRAMRRGHNCRDFVRAVTDAHAALDTPSIGTDVIVGFPGEDIDAFDRTVAQLEALPLSYLHVFSFSRRAGTAADTMAQQIDPGEIARRSRVLRALSSTKAASFRQAHAGRELDVVVNRQPKKRSEQWAALSGNYLEVDLTLADGARFAGQRIRVTLADDGRTATPAR
ncbi:MAG: MiaB/RimO family radical SAM methylthiotransferase [Nannocystaceae bacterium]|nr:MiaB/RimO family radical SAM methylthiotransferase [Nannocystaceae bacterium]